MPRAKRWAEEGRDDKSRLGYEVGGVCNPPPKTGASSVLGVDLTPVLSPLGVGAEAGLLAGPQDGDF